MLSLLAALAFGQVVVPVLNGATVTASWQKAVSGIYNGDIILDYTVGTVTGGGSIQFQLSTVDPLNPSTVYQTEVSGSISSSSSGLVSQIGAASSSVVITWTVTGTFSATVWLSVQGIASFAVLPDAGLSVAFLDAVSVDAGTVYAHAFCTDAGCVTSLMGGSGGGLWSLDSAGYLTPSDAGAGLDVTGLGRFDSGIQFGAASTSAQGCIAAYPGGANYVGFYSVPCASISSSNFNFLARTNGTQIYFNAPSASGDIYFILADAQQLLQLDTAFATFGTQVAAPYLDAGAIGVSTTVVADGGIQGQVVTAGNYSADHRSYPLVAGAVYGSEFDFYATNGYDYGQLTFGTGGYFQVMGFSGGFQVNSSNSAAMTFLANPTGAIYQYDPQIVAESEGWPVGARESIDLIPFAYGSGAVGVNIAAQAVNSTSTEVLTGPVFIGNLGYDGGVEGIWLGLTSNDAGPTNYTLMTDGGRIWADGTNVPFLIGGDTTTRNLTVDGGLTVNGQASLFGITESLAIETNTSPGASADNIGTDTAGNLWLQANGNSVEIVNNSPGVPVVWFTNNGQILSDAGLQVASNVTLGPITTTADSKQTITLHPTLSTGASLTTTITADDAGVFTVYGNNTHTANPAFIFASSTSPLSGPLWELVENASMLDSFNGNGVLAFSSPAIPVAAANSIGEDTTGSLYLQGGGTNGVEFVSDGGAVVASVSSLGTLDTAGHIQTRTTASLVYPVGLSSQTNTTQSYLAGTDVSGCVRISFDGGAIQAGNPALEVQFANTMGSTNYTVMCQVDPIGGGACSYDGGAITPANATAQWEPQFRCSPLAASYWEIVCQGSNAIVGGGNGICWDGGTGQVVLNYQVIGYGG